MEIIKENEPIAKSQCPVWRGIWRGGLEVAVKYLLVADKEVELHKYVF
jgi:hypothetical protein